MYSSYLITSLTKSLPSISVMGEPSLAATLAACVFAELFFFGSGYTHIDSQRFASHNLTSFRSFVTAMTVVTDFLLYSEIAVIFVTAVISYKLYKPTFACAFRSVLNAHRLQNLAGKLP